MQLKDVKIGQRVQYVCAGNSESGDQGVVDDIVHHEVWVMWDNGERLWCSPSSLKLLKDVTVSATTEEIEEVILHKFVNLRLNLSTAKDLLNFMKTNRILEVDQIIAVLESSIGE